MFAVYAERSGEEMSLTVKCPHCLKPNKLKSLETQIDEWYEDNNVSCKECDEDFNLSAYYVGYEAMNEFDTDTYLKVRGLEIPKDVSAYAVKCWLDQYFEEDNLFARSTEYIPDAWGTDPWLRAREFALMAYALKDKE